MLTDAPAWDVALGFCACEMLDVFHLYAFVALEAARLGGWPALLYLRHAVGNFALPLVLRPIPGQEGLCDATSVYGYNGCLSSGPVDDATRAHVADAFGRALDRRGCVSVFNRGHPFLPPVIPGARRIGETLYVDLAAGESDYERGLSDGHHYEIRKLRECGIRLERDTAGRYAGAFYDLYMDTMRRRGAGIGYHFSPEYIRDLLQQRQFGGELHLAWAGDQLVAAALFLRHGRISHYHLSASVVGATKYPAIKLILDEFIRTEIRSGRTQKLHLGGGVGGAADSLFQFKRGFGGKPVPYYQTRWIIRPADYARLSAGKRDTGYFPLYRCPA